MSIVWLSTLPSAPLVDGYSEHAPNLLLRTAADQGPARVRRKCTSKPWKFPARMRLTRAQTLALETFVYTTLGGGALRFEFTHARTGATVELRFVPKSDDALYTLVPISSMWWTADMVFEVLP